MATLGKRSAGAAEPEGAASAAAGDGSVGGVADGGGTVAKEQVREARFADTTWLLAEAGYWHEANAAASTCREIHSDERVLLGGTARLVANKALGRTKLHHACIVGNVPRVRELLNCGLPSRAHSADPNAKTSRFPALDGTYRLSMTTPLDIALGNGQVEIARELVKCGAKLESAHCSRFLRFSRLRFSRPPSEEEERSEREAMKKSEALMCELLRAPSVTAGTALKCALSNGLVEVVREKLAAGAIENLWTLPLAENEGTSFDVTFNKGSRVGISSFYENLQICRVEVGGQAHAQHLRLFDIITHVAGTPLAGTSDAERSLLIDAARAVESALPHPPPSEGSAAHQFHPATRSWTITVARPAAAEVERLLSEIEEGEELRELVFDLQQDDDSEAVLRELATLPRRVVDALEINRELGSEAWVRELCTAANLGSAKSRDDCFHAAARSGAADLVEECIRLGVDVNSSNTWPDHVDMAVLKAAEKGHAAVVALLCRSPEINVTIALVSACMCGLLKEADELCDRGADIDFFSEHNYAGTLTSSAENGHTAVVRMLCDRGAYLGFTGTQHGRLWASPLELACKNGHADTTAALISAGADVECGAIYTAIENGRDACFRMLCEAGAEVNGRVPGSRLFFWTGRRSIAALDFEDEKRRTVSIRPLGLACVCGRADFAAELLRRGAHRNIADSGGNSVLAGACIEGHEDVVRLLLSPAAGAVVGADGKAVLDALNINLCDSAGRSALAWACIKHRPECVRLLLERADLDTASRDARGFNAADLVLGHAGMLEMLRAKGIVPS